MRKKKVLSCLLVPLLSANLLLSGCSRTADEPATKSGFYFNTVISVSIYEKGSEELLDDCFALAQKYEGYFSNTIPDSDISKINDAGGAPVTVHDETIELLKTGISYGDLSGGKFDITIGRLSDLWDISTKALLDQTDVSMIPSDTDIQAALATSGWIAGRDMKEQPESFAEQFGYAQSYFGKALSSLTDTYSHIYGAEDGEVDFAASIMQRRILVVLLPSLEKAPAELASLGKISLSAIRNACAVGLGANIEGDAADVLEALPTDTIGIGPYLCIVDEYAAIVTPGFEVVLTQGRGLGIAAIVASQDYAGILEADQKGAQQMVANTSIKIFMKLQDAEKTWELIRGQAGQSTVLRTTGFNVNEQISSDYRDANSTTVEQEDRVVLRDLQEQIEGEAHFVFSGQIVRGDMFYANPSLKKAQLRVPQLLQLSLEKQYDHAA